MIIIRIIMVIIILVLRSLKVELTIKSAKPIRGRVCSGEQGGSCKLAIVKSGSTNVGTIKVNKRRVYLYTRFKKYE